MNDYTLQAAACQKVIDKGNIDQDTERELRLKVKIYEFLGSLSQTERLHIFDSGVFNDVCLGYMRATLDKIGVDSLFKESACETMSLLFDQMLAEEAARHL